MARNWLLPFIDPRQLASVLRLPRFFLEWIQFRREGTGGARFFDLQPCLMDRTYYTPFDPHYFYQAAWMARELAKERPPLHVDIGSSVGLVSILSATVPTLFMDYRPLHAQLSGLTTVAGDITKLPFADASMSSLSSLHVIEHIGLGRYGDPINPSGSFSALRELERVLAPGGRLYLSTPVGRERVCFNAHRVFDAQTILSALPSLKLENFSLVDDDGQFNSPAEISRASGLAYGCGMFLFSKR